MTERPHSIPSSQRPAHVHPRVILAWVAVIVAVSIGMYAIAPYILPARVIEGPMVQAPTPQGASLVWYLSRPAECRLIVTVVDEDRDIEVERDGRRCVAQIDNLSPGRRYPYRILVGSRRLTDDLAFTTPPAANRPYAFIAFGDSGKGTRVQYLLAGEMARSQPPADFLLHTGDIVYPDGGRDRYNDRFFAPYRALISRVAFWPCLGNHDVQDDGSAPAYSEIFVLPENGPADQPAGHNYCFDYANCRVAVIDSNVPESVMLVSIAPWLRNVMSETDATWKFVALHHPPYTAGKYRPDERVQRTLVPVFEEVNVDIVFAGHDHSYQRLKPLHGGQVVEPDAGVQYIITGAGGARLYEQTGNPQQIARMDFQHHSFTHVTIDNNTLLLRQISEMGDVLDSYEMNKTPQTAPASKPAASHSETAPADHSGLGDGLSPGN